MDMRIRINHEFVLISLIKRMILKGSPLTHLQKKRTLVEEKFNNVVEHFNKIGGKC